MTESPPVWRGWSKWARAEARQIEVWPSLAQLRALLRPWFTVR